MPVCPYTIVVEIECWKGPMFAGASSRHQRCCNGRVPIGDNVRCWTVFKCHERLNSPVLSALSLAFR